ncbi:MAG TPA: hypothetical protein VMS19_01310, partial [Methyloceanibacter sp.]|nr:hypothetical protein [Methyloceanibacter sp.]
RVEQLDVRSVNNGERTHSLTSETYCGARRTAQVAKGVGAALGVDQAEISCGYDLVESMPERAEHRTSATLQEKGFQ